MGKPLKKSKRFGHDVSKPGALDEQIVNDQFAKPSKRIKARNIQREKVKKQVVNIRGALEQLGQLQDEVSAIERDEDGEPSHMEEEQEADDYFPPNVDTVLKNFEKELDVKIDDDDKIYAAFMSGTQATNGKTCMELIRDTLIEKHTEIRTQVDEELDGDKPKISPEVLETVQESGRFLSRYRSGPIPKVMKILPKMRNWLELLYHSSPEKWSAAAMFQMTRVFANQKLTAQTFFNKVLLPRCRDDIAHYKRLNYHLYQSLCKACFDPPGFFKGIILALIMAGDCTMREAVLFATVIKRKSINMNVAAAAMMKLAQLRYSGATSIFLRVLLHKKYTLPWNVIDSLVEHFVSFKLEHRKLPVLWHQSLPTFVQHYKEDLSSDQKDQLYGLAAYHSHKAITQEVRRELENSKCRKATS